MVAKVSTNDYERLCDVKRQLLTKSSLIAIATWVGQYKDALMG